MSGLGCNHSPPLTLSPSKCLTSEAAQWPAHLLPSLCFCLLPSFKAIGQGSSEEHQVRAWEAVTPLVQQLREFYEFSTELEESVVHLLTALTSADMTPSQHLESQQALTKQFAEILHFTLSFDDMKVNSYCCTPPHTPHHTLYTHTTPHTTYSLQAHTTHTTFILTTCTRHAHTYGG